MDIRVLAEFVSLVETRSFQETAAQMSVSQSTLSKHIQKLEDELGTILFIRSQQGVKLSVSGDVYYPYAKQILQLQNEAAASLEKRNNEEKNVLSIVFDPLYGQYGLIDTLAEFADIHPNYELQLIESSNAVEYIREHRCAIAFVDESEASMCNLFNKLVYMTDNLAVVVREDHPLAAQKSVALTDLMGEKFIIHSAYSDKLPDETRKFKELCAAANFVPNIAVESKMTSTMIHHVRAGRGIAVLNRMRIQHDLTGIRVIDIYPRVNSNIYMLYPKKLASPCAREFLSYMKNCNIR